MYITREDESEAIIEHYERKIDLLSEKIAKLNARIAKLEAWKNAVPVQDIIAYFDNADTVNQSQIDAISAWIDAQVQPTTSQR